MSSLQTGSPFPLYLVGTMKGCKKKEAYLHEVFEDERVSGEWFDVSDSLSSYVVFKCGASFCHAHLNERNSHEALDICEKIDQSLDRLILEEKNEQKRFEDTLLNSVRQKISQAFECSDNESFHLNELINIFDGNEKNTIRKRISNSMNCVVKLGENREVLFYPGKPRISDVFNTLMGK